MVKLRRIAGDLYSCHQHRQMKDFYSYNSLHVAEPLLRRDGKELPLWDIQPIINGMYIGDTKESERSFTC